MKNILVTGGAGFIGSNLIKRLLKEGHSVTSIDNYDSGLESNHHNSVIYKNDDIEKISFMPQHFDTIYHLAALSRIQPSFENPEETFRVNVSGTQKVCEFARRIGAKLIYAGSSSRWHDPYQSPYAAYKHVGEEICKMYKKTYSMDIEIARFYNVYGPNEIVDGDWAAVIGIWRRQVRDGEEITIVGDGNQRRDFTHVDDIVNGLILAGDNISNREFQLGTGKEYSILEIAAAFDHEFEFIDPRPGDRPNGKADLTLTNEILGYEPSIDVMDYIKQI